VPIGTRPAQFKQENPMPPDPHQHRPAAVAGQFYSADPDSLRAQLSGWLSSPTTPARSGAPKMLVVPHAGYMYSGAMAARAYALLAPFREQFTRVVLLGPCHRVAVHGLAMPSVEGFDTPLGSVPLDREALGHIAGLPQVVVSDAAHALEHSLEVQLPFLQQVLGDFTLVPLAVGSIGSAAVAEVLETLWGGDETLIVISTDLSHFLSAKQARARDERTVQRMLTLTPTLVPEEACGAMPLNGALMAAARHGLQPVLLGACNSGDVTGDRDRVVGYAALALWASEARQTVDDISAPEQSIPEEAGLGAALLARARNAIAARIGQPLRAEPDHPNLEQPGATFVTLHHRGRLRGCIGRLEAGSHSLDQDVRLNAHRAAFEDPRFNPLAAHEWEELDLEVSLLQPPEPLAWVSEDHALASLRPGVDGVIFRWRQHRSTFLPQVWEQLPDAAGFLAALKQKAGLPADFWADDVELARYRVRVFRETGEVSA
jgi:AmmeMemoRadiSam system protein B/AmmeMemoRadiSam system protein A